MSLSKHQLILKSSLLALLLASACGGTPAGEDAILDSSDVVAESQEALTGAPVKALILVDRRLYNALTTTIDEYRSLAERRRGFSIGLQVLDGLDDWTHTQVRSYLVQQRAANAGLEGVLFVGNVKLPSFYKTRNDIILTRLYPNYYEDLDASYTKFYANGAIDPVCNETNDPNCQMTGAPFTVPAHDFDGVAKGANPDPELWASFMPVGVTGTQNTYTDFANQLRPYLNKVISFYKLKLATNGRFYFVGNDKGETFDLIWDAFGKTKIDFYGKAGPNGETGDACINGSQNLCYVRWPTENYASAANFISAWDASPWVGENWQTPSVYSAHMNAARYDVVEVNVHSFDQGALTSTPETRALTKAGLLVSLNGCGVAGFAQPFSPSNVDNPWTLPSENVTLAYLYGSSGAIAAMGNPHWRGHFSHTPSLYKSMTWDHTYLGAAHRLRMKKLYEVAGTSAYELKEHAGEMLFGDPFMDLGWFEGFESGSARWTTAGGSWSIVNDGGLVYKQGATGGTARSLAGETSWTTQRISARVKALSWNNADRLVSLVGRYTNETNFYQLAVRGNVIDMRKVVGGAWTTITSVPFTFATGTWYTVKLEIVGTSLKAFVNGAQVLSVTDSALATGKVGVGTFNATAEFDSVTVMP